MRSHIKTIFWICLIIFLFVLYYSSGYFFIYNNDAYVDANWVKIAARVTGPIDQVKVKDNQYVKQGSPLLNFLQDPFEIAVRQAQANLMQAQANILILETQSSLAELETGIQQAEFNLAKLEFGRYQALVKTSAISKELFDEKRENLQIAAGQLEKAKQNQQLVLNQLAEGKAKVAEMQSALDQASYNLKQSRLYAPANGVVNHLRVYTGDFANKGDILFSFVDTDTWRVVANIKESNLVGVNPGQKVWLYLSSHPWTLYRGEVESIGRGVARAPVQTVDGMPYIDPVTDWIRYDYRFPVRIKFMTLPEDHNHHPDLYLGSDVKVFIFR